jgi:negative regulator of flagellin synthesis FlgM
MPIDKSQSLSAAGIAGLRAVGLIDARTVRTAAGAKGAPAASATPGDAPAVTFQPSEALDPGQPPVDADRVQVIRKAIESGNYPIIPAKIADAMIAAGLLLRTPA